MGRAVGFVARSGDGVAEGRLIGGRCGEATGDYLSSTVQ